MKCSMSLCVTALPLCAESIPACQVFFYKGELHIIPPLEPLEEGWALSAPCPTVPQALALLSTRAEEFLAAEPIRAALNKRIHGYVGLHFGPLQLWGLVLCSLGFKRFPSRWDKVGSFSETSSWRFFCDTLGKRGISVL